jgi:hypothetical protein
MRWGFPPPFKNDGRMLYLWRAVDAEGEVLDALVQSRRSKQGETTGAGHGIATASRPIMVLLQRL